MTISIHDGFAILPKHCDYCGRLFIWEPYDIRHKLVGIDYHPLEQVKCVVCLEKEKHNYV